MERRSSLLTVSYPYAGLGEVMGVSDRRVSSVWEKQSKSRNDQYLLYIFRKYKLFGLNIGLFRGEHCRSKGTDSPLPTNRGKDSFCLLRALLCPAEYPEIKPKQQRLQYFDYNIDNFDKILPIV